MLPPAHRLRRSDEFAAVLRHGARARRGNLVVHHLPGGAGESGGTAAALVGLVVGKSVGGSVVRHRVSRRLRAQLSDRLTRLPVGSRTVVRALPGVDQDRSGRIGADLDAALAKVLGTR